MVVLIKNNKINFKFKVKLLISIGNMCMKKINEWLNKPRGEN
ncbi:MAG: hypothetical protein ACJAX4_002648 [Clostridium sp.]|jgi:hypothetical protein